MQGFCLFLLGAVLFGTAAQAATKADLVRVSKTESKLYLIANDEPFSSFDVVFGAAPKGHKQREGDERTPEGRYQLDFKKADSGYFKAIHISYPNEADVRRAAQRGEKPGGAVMIHGQKNGFGWLSGLTQQFNWTNGCIALSNQDMQQVWDAVDAGTPIQIDP